MSEIIDPFIIYFMRFPHYCVTVGKDYLMDEVGYSTNGTTYRIGFYCTQYKSMHAQQLSVLFAVICVTVLYLMIALWHMECALADCNRLLFLNRFSEKSPVSHVACHLSEANSHPLLPSRPYLVPHTWYQSFIS